uniref:Pepsin inhibitor-3-like repeated domain-containing protein n=1 Tax=Setaria digitata TaxID=48799 RepID=A0A915PQP6_9BILA
MSTVFINKALSVTASRPCHYQLSASRKLAVVNVAYVEVLSVPDMSFSTIIIQFNDTICKVRNGVLSLNGKVIGNLTDQQEQELQQYNKEAKEWSNQLHWSFQQLFERLFQSVKSVWNHTWNFGFESLPQSTTPSNSVTEKEKLKEMASDEDFPVVNFPKPPSFCYP